MDIYTRIGMFLFIIGALLVVLASILPVDPTMTLVVYAALAVTGILSGILNVSDEEEHHFMLSGLVFVVTLYVLDSLLGFSFPMALNEFVRYATLFIGSMTLVLAIKNLLDMGSIKHDHSYEERMRHRSRELEALEHSRARRAWHFIVFLGVAATFVLLIVQVFFFEGLAQPMQLVILFIDWVVIIIFLIDLIVLYRESESAKGFLRHCWPDIIAAVPVPMSIFGVLKVVRLARYARLQRVAKLSQSAKFFSTKSGFHHYVEPRQHEHDPHRYNLHRPHQVHVHHHHHDPHGTPEEHEEEAVLSGGRVLHHGHIHGEEMEHEEDHHLPELPVHEQPHYDATKSAAESDSSPVSTTSSSTRASKSSRRKGGESRRKAGASSTSRSTSRRKTTTSSTSRSKATTSSKSRNKAGASSSRSQTRSSTKGSKRSKAAKRRSAKRSR